MNTKINVGLIGVSGKMGLILSELLSVHSSYAVGPSFDLKSNSTLDQVFSDNSYIVDFSSCELTEQLLKIAVKNPKPLILCTTGWTKHKIEPLLQLLSSLVPVVVASNTSIGAYLQYRLALTLAKALGAEYDVDVIEKHHKHKIDIPSGTAATLISGIQEVKKREYGIDYKSAQLQSGPRPKHAIGVAVSRSGSLPGEHEVVFTSDEDMISVKHISFSRQLFAKGAIRILDWLQVKQPAPGLYGMSDIIEM